MPSTTAPHFSWWIAQGLVFTVPAGDEGMVVPLSRSSRALWKSGTSEAPRKTGSSSARGRALLVCAWLSWIFLWIAPGAHAQTPEQLEPEADPERREQYLQEIRRAIDAYEAFELKEALVFFERAHALLPSARTHRGLGVTSFGLGMYERAIAELTSALQDERNPLTDDLRRDTELRLAQARDRIKPAPTQPQPAPSDGLSTQAWLAIASGAVGLVGLSVGSVFGAVSLSQGNSRDEHCVDQRCDARGVELADAAIRSGNISTVSFAVSLAGVAAGLTLWLTDSAPRERAGVRVRPGLASLQLEGAW